MINRNEYYQTQPYEGPTHLNNSDVASDNYAQNRVGKATFGVK